MSKVLSFKIASSKKNETLRSGDYWAIVTLCAVLSFMLMASMISKV